MTDVPRIESVFGRAEIAEMRARFAEEAAARAAQVTTEASRTLLGRSRTVIDKDRYVLTVVDGDVLDDAKAIEAEATAAAEQRLRDGERMRLLGEAALADDPPWAKAMLKLIDRGLPTQASDSPEKRCGCTADTELAAGAGCTVCGHRDHGRSGCDSPEKTT